MPDKNTPDNNPDSHDEAKTQREHNARVSARLDDQANQLSSIASDLKSFQTNLLDLVSKRNSGTTNGNTPLSPGPDPTVSIKNEPNQDITTDEQNDQDILVLTHPQFHNKDTTAKTDLDRMFKIRQYQLNKIPLLDDSNNPTTQGSTNFAVWKKEVVKYFGLYDKQFQNWIVKAAASINIDEAAQNKNYLFPVLPSSIKKQLSMMDLIEMTSAITNRISSTYEFLVSNIDNNDVAKAFFTVYVFMEPNSMDTRTQSLKDLFTLELPSDLGYSIPKFAHQIRQMANKINDHHGHQMINEIAVISTLRNAIRASARAEAYSSALSSIKDTTSLSQFLTHLSNNVEAHKLPKIPTDGAANMARTRGGGGGGKGRGRGGKGGGKGGNRNRNNRTTYLTGTNPQNGTQVVGKVIQPKQIKDPCFKMFTQGKCNRKDCPYNHKFNVISTDEDPEERKHNVREEEEEKNISANNAHAQYPTNQPTNQQAPAPEADEDDFEDLNPEYSINDNFHSNYADIGYEHSCSMATTHKVGHFDYNILYILLSFFLFPFSLMHTSFRRHSDHNILHILLSFFLLPFSLLHTSVCMLSSLIMTTTSYIIRLPYNIAYYLLTYLCLLTHYITHKHLANAALHTPSFSHIFPIVMDSGCTIAMSGDLSLFDRKTMKAHRAKINLADTKSAIYSTHVGKINMKGQIIDALYVPKMSQTLLSLGWFLKQGFKVSSDEQGNLDLTLPDSKPYLSFILAHNNLFYIRESTTHNHSS